MVFRPTTEVRFFKCSKGTDIYSTISTSYKEMKLARLEYENLINEIGAEAAAYYTHKLTPSSIFSYIGEVPSYMKKDKNGYYSFDKKKKEGKSYQKRWDALPVFYRSDVIDSHLKLSSVFGHCGYNIDVNNDSFYFCVDCDTDYVAPDGLVEITNIEYRKASNAKENKFINPFNLPRDSTIEEYYNANLDKVKEKNIIVYFTYGEHETIVGETTTIDMNVNTKEYLNSIVIAISEDAPVGTPVEKTFNGSENLFESVFSFGGSFFLNYALVITKESESSYHISLFGHSGEVGK